ncbi:hypothetical protein [Acidithiobacillus ferriphilus]|uniref:hypothetical protein n=1 Tax=Acidithiobacillus ferriphilus TaxID=1689834 RepID=UPI001C60DA9C|nr:hypothetical protein [Acidithiobacillus ferriphilus]MEB8535535.1 hypothetical protein [Acidithiobacillus ferriphilus]
MFGFGEHQEAMTAQCPCCQTQMQDKGTHGVRLGGVTGLLGAGMDAVLGNVGEDANEAFEKKMTVQLFVCPQCREVSMKYVTGL